MGNRLSLSRLKAWRERPKRRLVAQVSPSITASEDSVRNKEDCTHKSPQGSPGSDIGDSPRTWERKVRQSFPTEADNNNYRSFPSARRQLSNGSSFHRENRSQRGRLATSLRGSIYNRKVLRRPSDFSDLQHLGSASDGIKLTDRQKSLITSAYPAENSKHRERAEMIKRFAQRLTKDATNEQLESLTTLLRLRQNQAVYNHDKHDDINANRYPPGLVWHCECVVQVLDMAVASLDHLDDSLGSYLTALGAKHADTASGVTKDISHEMWELFSLALCDCANAWHFPHDRLETLVAWRVVVFFLLNKIRYGYDVEVERCYDWSQPSPAAEVVAHDQPHHVLPLSLEEETSSTESFTSTHVTNLASARS